MEVFNVTPGSVHSCVEVLSKNNILAIAPGESASISFRCSGVINRETLFLCVCVRLVL